VHHLDSWVKRDQLDVTCFIISLYNAQHVSGVNTSILRNLRLMCWVISWATLIWFDVCWSYVVVWLWWCGIRMQVEALVLSQSNTTHEITEHISRNLLRMDVLTSETCWALYKEIIKQVTSSWSLFTQLVACIFHVYFSITVNLEILRQSKTMETSFLPVDTNLPLSFKFNLTYLRFRLNPCFQTYENSSDSRIISSEYSFFLFVMYRRYKYI